jgi:hypothetical protein
MKILATGGTEKTPAPATPATEDADANKPAAARTMIST